LDIVHELEQNGIALDATDQDVDTGTSAGRTFIGMLGVFSQFETEIRERQMEGFIWRRINGGPARADTASRDTIVTALCEELGVSKTALYRNLTPKGRPRENGERVLAKGR
jgi:DNA invertase Pin-like site-specific DNA recombinase